MDDAIPTITLAEGAEEVSADLALGLIAAPWMDRPPVRHAHAFHQVTMFLSDPGRVECELAGSVAFEGRPTMGDFWVCPAAVPLLLRWERPFEFVSIRLMPHLVDRVAGEIGVRGNLAPTALRQDLFVRELMRKLAGLAHHPAPARRWLADSLATTLACHLLETNPTSPAALVAPAPQSFARIERYVAANLAGDLSVNRLAAVAGMSPYHFIRRFQAATGTTPHQYVIRQRVELAQELLRTGSGIGETAIAVGFSGQSHLHQHFRRLVGVTPGDFRRTQTQHDGHPR